MKVTLSWVESSCLALPKSLIWTFLIDTFEYDCMANKTKSYPHDGSYIIFWGVTSRWQMLRLWRYSKPSEIWKVITCEMNNPLQTWWKMALAFSIGTLPFRIRVSSVPGKYGNTKFCNAFGTRNDGTDLLATFLCLVKKCRSSPTEWCNWDDWDYEEFLLLYEWMSIEWYGNCSPRRNVSTLLQKKSVIDVQCTLQTGILLIATLWPFSLSASNTLPNAFRDKWWVTLHKPKSVTSFSKGSDYVVHSTSFWSTLVLHL